MAATRSIARAYKVDDRLGTLVAGKIADLVVLDANPLEAAAHYRKIRMVMKEGRIVDRQRLPTARLLTAEATSD
jgi:imidazolonepropionase-like amidohydrolase